MFDKFIQKVFVGYLKTQAKKYVGLAVEQLNALDENVTADAITDAVFGIIKAKFRFTVPDHIDACVDKVLAGLIDKVRDLAVAKITELNK